MSLIGLGTDIIQIHRIGVSVKRYGDKFLNRIFTPAERAKAESLIEDKKIAYYAKRFAAKEALSKALGSGIGRLAAWQEIEILNDDKGAPTLTLSGETANYLKTLAGEQATKIHISLSDDEYAVATVLVEKI